MSFQTEGEIPMTEPTVDMFYHSLFERVEPYLKYRLGLSEIDAK